MLRLILERDGKREIDEEIVSIIGGVVDAKGKTKNIGCAESVANLFGTIPVAMISMVKVFDKVTREANMSIEEMEDLREMVIKDAEAIIFEEKYKVRK